MSLADAVAARRHHTLSSSYSLPECQQRIGPDTSVFVAAPSDPRPFFVRWQGPDRVALTLTGLRTRQLRRQLRVHLVRDDRGTTIHATAQLDPLQNVLVFAIGTPFLVLFAALFAASIAHGANVVQVLPLPFLSFVPVLVYTAGRVTTDRQVDVLLRNLEFVLSARPSVDKVTPLVGRFASRAVARQPLVSVPATASARPTFRDRIREQRRFTLSSSLPSDECRRRIQASGLFDVRTNVAGDLLLTCAGLPRRRAYRLHLQVVREGGQTMIDASGRQQGAILALLFPWAPMLAGLLALGALHGVHGLVVVSPFAAIPVAGAVVAYALGRVLPGSQHNFLPAALADLLEARAVAA